MRILMVINEVGELIARQTTTLLAAGALRRGWTLALCGVDQLGCDEHGRVSARAHSLSGAVADSAALIERLRGTAAAPFTLQSGDVLWYRTNPGRDPGRAVHHQLSLAYGRLAQREGCVVLSDPEGLARASSKLYLSHFPASIRPRGIVSADRAALMDWIRAENSPLVVKPLLGSRGQDVYRVEVGEPEASLGAKLDAVLKRGPVQVQEYLPEAPQGDIRLLLLDGALMQLGGGLAAVRRIPPEGEFRSNMHLGGRAEPAPLDARLARIARLAGPILARDGIFLAGLDVIGDKVVEANVYSPGGLGSAGDFHGVDFVAPVLDRVATRASGRLGGEAS